MGKVIVKVLAEHDTQGSIRPIQIIWNDGRRFDIDRVLDVRQAASLKAGGLGMRYTCRICGKEIKLFDDNGIWFIETD
ncbi:MAG: hypothetical protein E6713_07800 [Sporomusaceae bacterium]|nr:hypothetical protein [Sporomusaceae bacterium]